MITINNSTLYYKLDHKMYEFQYLSSNRAKLCSSALPASELLIYVDFITNSLRLDYFTCTKIGEQKSK